MILVEKVYSRLDTSVPFHTHIIDGSHFTTHYDMTGKRLEFSNTISDDGLTMTHRAKWLNIESFNESLNDPICITFFQERDNYNLKNNITYTDTKVTILN